MTMNNKLEAKISRLESILKIKESYDRDELQLKVMRAVEALSKATDLVSQVAIALDYDDSHQTQEWQSIEDRLNGIITKINKLAFKL